VFELTEKPSTRWDKTAGRTQTISLAPLERGSLAGKAVFTMGSCFAVELRHELTKRGYDTYPKYFDLDFDSGKVAVGALPDRDNVNHYNIRSILQEFENVGPEPLYTPDRFWNLEKQSDRRGLLGRLARKLLAESRFDFEPRWQDPFRMATFAESLPELTAVSQAITEKIKEGAVKAHVFIITLGMSEIWCDRASSLAICTGYGGSADEHLCEFYDMTVDDTRAELARAVEAIRRLNNSAPIVFSVSPVPLRRTFKDESVVTANMLSKAKQRVAVDEVVRSYDDVHYFPSYELLMDGGGQFLEDGRHVAIPTVQYIVGTFLDWFQGSAIAETPPLVSEAV